MQARWALISRLKLSRMPKRRLLADSGEPQHGSAHEKVFRGVERANDGERLPQKKYFRQRAHINPLSVSNVYQYPISPERMSWASHYPQGNISGTLGRSRHVDVADVGCGFGGLVVGLAAALPQSLVLGMEIRPKVTEYVRLRILALRKQAAGSYDNASVLKINAMKYLPCFFGKGQLDKLFFCFADPHFKPANHRRRIVNTELLSEYAYVLRPGGHLYTITDVKDLANWQGSHGDAHPSFVRLTQEELDADPCVALMTVATEEGKKVSRSGGDNGKSEKYVAAFRRLTDVEAVARAQGLSGGDFWTQPTVAYEYLPAPSQAEYAAMYGSAKSREKDRQRNVSRAAAAALPEAAPSSAVESAKHESWRPAVKNTTEVGAEQQ